MLNLHMATQIAALREDHVANLAMIRLRLGVLPKVVFQVARAVKNFSTIFVETLKFEIISQCFGVHFFEGSVPAIWDPGKWLLLLTRDLKRLWLVWCIECACEHWICVTWHKLADTNWFLCIFILCLLNCFQCFCVLIFCVLVQIHDILKSVFLGFVIHCLEIHNHTQFRKLEAVDSVCHLMLKIYFWIPILVLTLFSFLGSIIGLLDRAFLRFPGTLRSSVLTTLRNSWLVE